MSETISLFGIQVYGLGLCTAGAALIYLLLSSLVSGKRGLPCGTASLLTVLTIPMAVLFARLLYCAVNFSTFTEEFENAALMLRFWDGGLSLSGAVLGTVLAGLLTARIMKLPFANVADVMAVPMGLSLALIRFGMQFTDLGGGKSVDAGWVTEKLPALFTVSKMGKKVIYCMAVPHYQIAACLIIFAVTLLVFAGRKSRAGHTALLFFSLYGAAEILLESLRDDGHMTITFLRIEQVAAAAMLLIALGILCSQYRKSGGAKGKVLMAWAAVVVAAVGVVLIEFALDGRLSIGARSMGVNYLFMALCCILMAVMPCLMMRAVQNKKA